MPSNSKTVSKLLTEQFVAVGFKKVKPGILTREYAPDVLAWVGLNRATRDGAVEINPVVGIRHQVVERLLANLLGEEFDDTVPPTAAMNVGYLLASPHYQAFIFDESRSDGDIALELIDLVMRRGVEFVAANVTLSALVVTLRTSTRLMPEQTAYRLPVALFLAGRYDEAHVAIEDKTREIGSRQDPAAIRYLEFSNRLKEKIAETCDRNPIE